MIDVRERAARGEARRDPGDDLASALARRRGRRRAAQRRSSSTSSSCCSSTPAATRRATSSPAACSRCSEHPDQLRAPPRRARAARRRRSRRCCAGERRCMHFRRTATRDTELGGRAIADRATRSSCSTARPIATRRVFADPDRFDVARGRRTSTSRSAAAARTSASARTSPASRSGRCSPRCSAASPRPGARRPGRVAAVDLHQRAAADARAIPVGLTPSDPFWPRNRLDDTAAERPASASIRRPRRRRLNAWGFAPASATRRFTPCPPSDTPVTAMTTHPLRRPGRMRSRRTDTCRAIRQCWSW